MSWEVKEREVSVRRRKVLALLAWCLNPRAVCVSSQIASSVQAWKKSLTQMAVPLAMAETPVPRRADCRRPPREVHTPPAGPYWGQLIGELPHGAARQIFSVIAETLS